MKKLFVLVLALCLFTLPALALADGAKLTVTGNATVTLAPDLATITIGVGTDGDTVEQASKDTAAAIDKMIAAVKALGVEDEDIQTTSFYVNPRYNYSSDTPMMVGYRVEHMLSVTVRDLDKLGQILDDAMTAGANQMYGMNFGSSIQGEAADEALQNAIIEASRKAELMAKATSQTLGELKEINEKEPTYSVIYNRSAKATMDTAAGTQLQAGTLEVSATVELVYETK